MFAFPAKRPRLGPRLDDKIVRFLKPFPVVVRRGVVGHALPASAAHPARDQPTAGDDVDHRQLLDQPKRVVPNRQDIAEQHDLGPIRHARQNRCFHVHGAAHAKWRAVMLVEHQPIKAHFLGVDLFIQIAVVELIR